MIFVVKHPIECSVDEINQFYVLIANSNLVSIDGLKKRILNSERLAFCYIGKALVGVRSIKIPIPDYKKRIFECAKIPHLSDKYRYEYGWYFVKEKRRGCGIGDCLATYLDMFIDKFTAYSVVKETNEVMLSKLKKRNMKRIGEPFSNDDGDILSIWAY